MKPRQRIVNELARLSSYNPRSQMERDTFPDTGRQEIPIEEHLKSAATR
jgi:hypothetical protein